MHSHGVNAGVEDVVAQPLRVPTPGWTGECRADPMPFKWRLGDAPRDRGLSSKVRVEVTMKVLKTGG